MRWNSSGLGWAYIQHWASQVAQWIKNLPAMQEMQETQVWFLGHEDPLEEGTAPHSSILAWRIPWTEEPGGLQFMGSQRVGHDWSYWASTHIPYLKTGILRKEDHRRRYIREGHVPSHRKMETEIGVMLPQVKEHLAHPKLEEERTDPTLEASEETQPLGLISDFWAPEQWENTFLLF